MEVVLLGMVTDLSGHSAKALAPICPTPSPIVRWLSFGKPRKASLPMFCALIVSDVNPVQPKKTSKLMSVTLFGISIVARPVHPENAWGSMLVTLLGILTDVRLEQPENANELIVIVPFLTLSLVFVGIVPLYPYSTLLIYTTPLGLLSYHGVPMKAEFPMLTTLLGILIELRLEQPENASMPMLVTLLGILIEARLMER